MFPLKISECLSIIGVMLLPLISSETFLRFTLRGYLYSHLVASRIRMSNRYFNYVTENEKDYWAQAWIRDIPRIFLAVSLLSFLADAEGSSTSFGNALLSFCRTFVSHTRMLVRPPSLFLFDKHVRLSTLFIFTNIIGNCGQVSPGAVAPQKFNQLDRRKLSYRQT